MTDRKQLEEQILEQVTSLIAEDPSLFVVQVALKGSFGNQRLIISLDGDDGVSIEKCVSVSRGLSSFLEENDLIDGKYHLEVTSVGIDQPLTSMRQYKKNIGRSLSIKMKDGSKMEGELKEVDDQGVTLLKKEKKKEQSLMVSFEEMDSTKVLVSFK